MRLNRFLAHAGVASRRKCEAIIAAGRVAIDGEVVTDPARAVDAAANVVTVDGASVTAAAAHRVYVLNKPDGVLTSLSDPHGRPTVGDLLPASLGRVYPVGRLDNHTTGLLLITDDGDLAHRVMHPRHSTPKHYLALVHRRPSAHQMGRLVSGVRLDDGPARAIDARLVATDGRHSVLRMILGDGRKRQVRRMCTAIGHPVVRLHRDRIGPVELGDVAEGELRELDADARARLRRDVGLD